MTAPLHPLRTLALAVACAAALPALAQDYDEQPPPPPPEELPWATPQAPEPPAPRRARPAQPVYRPDAEYGERYQRPHPGYPVAPYRPAPVGVGPRAWYPQVELAFRAGVATPGGSAASGLAMDELFGEQVALGVELGVRTTPHLYVGLFAEGGVGGAGPTTSASGCLGTGRCDTGSASGRVGVGLRYHLAPYAPIDPWIGYGVAISGATVSGDDAYGSFSRTLTGVEFAKLSVGADLRLSRGSALGLYAEWTSGVFTQLEDRENGAVVGSGTLPSTTTHTWFTVGPRLRF